MKNNKEIFLAGEPVFDSIVDGPGLRMTIFTQGCPHHCPGCHNPETWSPTGGFLENTSNVASLFLEHEELDGITLSGGDPIFQPEAILSLLQQIKKAKPEANVWIYTGYLFEDLLASGDKYISKILELCDVLVDGPFQLENKSLNCLWRGSTNQRLIDVKKSLEKNKAVLWAV